jgi:hypothetical protein
LEIDEGRSLAVKQASKQESGTLLGITLLEEPVSLDIYY